MSEIHPSDNIDKGSPPKHVGDDFYQELTSNFEPQSQTSERHVVEEFLNEAAFHRERPSPEHFKDKILRKLFIHSNAAIPSSAAVGRLFSVKKFAKAYAQTDQYFEMLVFFKGACNQLVEL